MVEHDHVAGDHVGRHGPVGNRELVEALDEPRTRHVGAQQIVDRARVGKAGGRHHLAVAVSEFERRVGFRREPFLLDRLECPTARAADHLFPFDAGDELLDLRGGLARCVTAADQRAHAGAGDAVDRHVELLEDLQHADMGAALGAAAGQHQADAGSLGWLRGMGSVQRSERVEGKCGQAKLSA